MVDPEVGNEVPDEQVVPAKVGTEVVESTGGQSDTNVTEHDQVGILVLEERSARIEVVDTAAIAIVFALAPALTLLLVVVVASDVGQKVVGPSNELLAEKHHEGVNWSLLSQLRQFVDELAKTGGLLLASAGNKDHVALHVTGGLVVLAVGHLPAEVRDEQSGVNDPADNVVVELGG